ncbi:Orf28, partial [Pseudomonas syringae pv. pisi str. 1704B]
VRSSPGEQRSRRRQSRAWRQTASRVESNEGKTPALGDHQAKQLLNAPDTETLKGLRDRAILAVLPYHGLRREEAAQL